MQRLATVLCTSGLAVEAKIARAAGFPVVIRAADRDRTAALVSTAAEPTDCLISFGIAGGLAPELKAGTVIVSGEVVSERCRWTIEPRYGGQLTEFARSIGAVEGPVLGASSIVATQMEKQRAWAETRARCGRSRKRNRRADRDRARYPLHRSAHDRRPGTTGSPAGVVDPPRRGRKAPRVSGLCRRAAAAVSARRDDRSCAGDEDCLVCPSRPRSGSARSRG